MKNLMSKFSALKLVSLALGGVGLVIASELQRRETEEYVNRALDERGYIATSDADQQ